MTVTSASQTQYTQATNKSNNNKEVDKEHKAEDILQLDELLSKEGNAFFNELVVGMPAEDQIRIKLMLGFQMSIKSENVTNGKLHIERETGKLDTHSILSKLDLLITKGAHRQGELKDAIDSVLNGLKAFYTNTSEANANDKNQENSVVDKFLEDLYSKGSASTASAIIKETIQNKVNEYAQVLMDSKGDAPKSESEISKMLIDYKKELLEDYKKSLDAASNDNMTLEQQAIIKLLLEENTQEASSLEKLLATKEVDKTENVTQKETRTPEEITAEYRAMPGQAGIFYEGMFEEQQAAALAKHEPYYKKEYEHYEKYKDVFTPIYSNYTTEKAKNIGRELNAQFPEFQAMREKAYMGGTEQDKEAFQDMFWDYQAYNKYLREKYDMDMTSFGFNAASKESSKAYNFAVYDSLESGMSIKEATAKAQGLLETFGGREAQGFSLLFFSGLPEDIEATTKMRVEDVIDYDKQIDLRKYGIEHNFWSDTYLDSFKNDSLGVKSRIMYDIKLYSFLLENNEVVDNELAALKERAYKTEYGQKWYDSRNENGSFNETFKSSFQPKYDHAIYAKEIYDKYSDRIFDNIIIDSANNTESSDLEKTVGVFPLS